MNHMLKNIKCGVKRFSKTNVSFFYRRKCMGRWKIRLVLKLTYVCLNFESIFWIKIFDVLFFENLLKSATLKRLVAQNCVLMNFFHFHQSLFGNSKCLASHFQSLFLFPIRNRLNFKVNNSSSHGPWVMV